MAPSKRNGLPWRVRRSGSCPVYTVPLCPVAPYVAVRSRRTLASAGAQRHVPPRRGRRRRRTITGRRRRCAAGERAAVAAGEPEHDGRAAGAARGSAGRRACGRPRAGDSRPLHATAQRERDPQRARRRRPATCAAAPGLGTGPRHAARSTPRRGPAVGEAVSARDVGVAVGSAVGVAVGSPWASRSARGRVGLASHDVPAASRACGGRRRRRPRSAR